MLLRITPNIFNKITLKKNYLAQCAGLRLVIIILISHNSSQNDTVSKIWDGEDTLPTTSTPKVTIAKCLIRTKIRERWREI